MQEKWQLVLEPRNKWYQIDFMGIWQYRDLMFLFVRRNFKIMYQQTALGPAWILLSPLITTVVFNVVFGGIAGISTDGSPQLLFYLLGTSVWGLFSNILNATSKTFIENRNIFSKVYFSRLVMPLSTAISNMLNFFIQLALFLIFWVFFLARSEVVPNFTLLLLPLLILEIMVLGLGGGLIVASLTTRYRDLQVAVGFGMQLLMYATPVVYPMSETGGLARIILLINPMTPIVETFRYAFLGNGQLWRVSLLGSVGTTLLVAALGLLCFNRIEKTFVDTI